MNYDYTAPAPVEEYGAELGALVRHLKARLEEFHCVSIGLCQEEKGIIQATFQGFSPQEMAEALFQFRQFVVVVEGDSLTFYLRKHHRHEENDTIWGGIYRHII